MIKNEAESVVASDLTLGGEYWTFCTNDGTVLKFQDSVWNFRGIFVFSTREQLKAAAPALIEAGWDFDGVGICTSVELNRWRKTVPVFLDPVLTARWDIVSWTFGETSPRFPVT